LDVGRFERHKDCCTRYGVKGLPHIIVFNTNGSIRLSAAGYKDAQALLAFLDRAGKTAATKSSQLVTAKAQDPKEKALFAAVAAKDVTRAKGLLKGKANVNARCPSCGNSLLYHAARNGDSKMVALLLEHRANVKIGNHTPLHIAAANGNVEMVKLLLKHGSNVNARCPRCRLTPLRAATTRKRTEVIKLLKAAGAKE
jgi:hypothetical protein